MREIIVGRINGEDVYTPLGIGEIMYSEKGEVVYGLQKGGLVDKFA